MDLDAIFRLIERAEQSAFTRIEVQQGDLKVVLERGTQESIPVTAYTPQQLLAQAETQQQEERNAVRAPISGVFYLAKEPGAEPFVQAGSKVHKGDTLCIIEAMKTMNEIRAPKDCVIAGILVSDGATISAGDVLFLLGEGS